MTNKKLNSTRDPERLFLGCSAMHHRRRRLLLSLNCPCRVASTGMVVESHDSRSRRLSMEKVKATLQVRRDGGGWRVGGHQDGLLDVLYGDSLIIYGGVEESR